MANNTKQNKNRKQHKKSMGFEKSRLEKNQNSAKVYVGKTENKRSEKQKAYKENDNGPMVCVCNDEAL